LFYFAAAAIAEESRTHKAWAGKNALCVQENTLQYPHIPAVFSFVITPFCSAKAAKHLSANHFLADFVAQRRNKVLLCKSWHGKRYKKVLP